MKLRDPHDRRPCASAPSSRERDLRQSNVFRVLYGALLIGMVVGPVVYHLLPSESLAVAVFSVLAGLMFACFLVGVRHQLRLMAAISRRGRRVPFAADEGKSAARRTGTPGRASRRPRGVQP